MSRKWPPCTPLGTPPLENRSPAANSVDDPSRCRPFFFSPPAPVDGPPPCFRPRPSYFFFCGNRLIAQNGKSRPKRAPAQTAPGRKVVPHMWSKFIGVGASPHASTCPGSRPFPRRLRKLRHWPGREPKCVPLFWRCQALRGTPRPLEAARKTCRPDRPFQRKSRQSRPGVGPRRGMHVFPLDILGLGPECSAWRLGPRWIPSRFAPKERAFLVLRRRCPFHFRAVGHPFFLG